MEFEGLWCVRFEAGQAWGYGHVVFTGGKILGGDSWWRYVGQYQIASDQAQMMVRIAPTPRGFVRPAHESQRRLNVLGHLTPYDLRFDLLLDDLAAGAIEFAAGRNGERKVAMQKII